MNERDYLTLGIVAAVVAGKMDAVDAMMRRLVVVDAVWASKLLEAMQRGLHERGVEP